MLPTDQAAVIHRIVYEINDPAARVAAVAALESAAGLQYLARCYNWDDEFDLPLAIADHPRCDLGIALELFWLAGAEELFGTDIPRDEYNEDWFTFCREITNRILSGRYARGMTTFDPALNVAQVHKYRKRGVPEVFLCRLDTTHSTASDD